MSTRVLPIRAPAVDPERATRRLGFRQGLLMIVVVALLSRLVVVAVTPQFAPATDSLDFDRIALSLAEHGSFPPSQMTLAESATAFRPPLFPIALAGVYKLVGVGSAKDRWRAGRVFEALLGAAAVVLIALIAARLWGPSVGLLSGALASVYPPLLLVGSSLMSESLFIPLMLAAVLGALTGRDSVHRWRWALISGVLVALASLTRSNGIVLVAPVCLLLWGRPWRSWRALRAPLAVVLATAVTLAPWAARNANVFHSFVPTTTESGFALAGTYQASSQGWEQYPAFWVPPLRQVLQLFKTDPRINEAQLSSHLTSEALTYIDAHPVSLLRTAGWSTLRLLNLTGSGIERWLARFEAYPPTLAVVSVYAFWLLALIALAAVVTKAAGGAPRRFWLFPAVMLATNALFAGTTRYRSPADPFVLMLAALGLLAAWRRIRRTRVPSPAA